MNSKIRSMVKNDRNDIFSILDNTAEFSSEEVVVAKELIDSFLDKGESSGYIVQVAQVEFSAAGYICYGRTPMTASTWDVYWIAVDKQKQGFGIGGSLLQFAEEDIVRSGGSLVVVETSSKESYGKTRQFYEFMQYETFATIPDFYAPGDGKVIFTKRVS